MRGKLAFYTGVLTYLLIVFGGYVASSESGMGCGPEWPLCNGSIIPELHGETLIEFGHRVIGAIIFFLTIILFIMIKKDRTIDTTAKKVANWMIILLTIQLVAGAIVVFYHLPPIIITIHLLIAMVFLGILIWYWRLDDGMFIGSTDMKKLLIPHLNTLIVMLLFTIAIGAYVKHKYYGLACGWFACGNSLFPKTIPGVMQTFHRFLALISVFYMIVLTYIVYIIKFSLLKKRMLFALVIILIQVIIGIMTILTSISISFAVWHLAAATLVLAIIMEARIIISK